MRIRAKCPLPFEPVQEGLQRNLDSAQINAFSKAYTVRRMMQELGRAEFAARCEDLVDEKVPSLFIIHSSIEKDNGELKKGKRRASDHFEGSSPLSN